MLRLKRSSEFRTVYSAGRRYDNPLMTVFVLPNGLAQHRLGITASRKVSRQAVKRNRLKRLAREAFRLSAEPLSELQSGRDWVINPRRAMLEVGLNAVLPLFLAVVEKVRGEVAPAETLGEVESV